MNQPSHSRLHAITVASTILLACAFVVVNLEPRFPWWRFEGSLCNSDDQYEHGWPFTYMLRELYIANADMGGMIHHPWPYPGNPPLVAFYPAWLFINSVVAICVVTLTARSINSWIGRRKIRFVFGLKLLFVFTALAGIFFAIVGTNKGAIYVFVFMVPPSCLVLMSLCSCVVLLAQTIRAMFVSRSNSIGAL